MILFQHDLVGSRRAGGRFTPLVMVIAQILEFPSI